MITILQTEYSLRIFESHDWVVYVILLCILAYIFMMISLHRDGTVKEFLLQKYSDSGNTFLSWLITSAVFCLLTAVLFSKFVPTVPEVVSRLQLFGFQLNRFGFLIWTIVLFYALKTLLGFFFYQCVNAGKMWFRFYFAATKFYFVFSLVLIPLCFVQYFTPVNPQIIFGACLLIYAVAFIFKMLFYLFHYNKILPKSWYYKFLYICTLQIAPLVALWRWIFL